MVEVGVQPDGMVFLQHLTSSSVILGALPLVSGTQADNSAWESPQAFDDFFQLVVSHKQGVLEQTSRTAGVFNIIYSCSIRSQDTPASL